MCSMEMNTFKYDLKIRVEGRSVLTHHGWIEVFGDEAHIGQCVFKHFERSLFSLPTPHTHTHTHTLYSLV